MKTKNILALVCLFAMLFTVSTNALAAAPFPLGTASTDPHYTDEYTVTSIMSRAANLMNAPRLSISSPSTGKVSVTASVTTADPVDKLGFTVLSIEKWNGSSWASVASWTDRYSSNTNTFSWSGSASGCESKANYRASCTFYAKEGNDVQTISATTSYITCR